MDVYLTGATGFVGHHVLNTLLKHEHNVTALIRNGSEDKLTQQQRNAITIHNGNILHQANVHSGAKDHDAIINLVGTLKEHPPKATFQNLHVEAVYNIVTAAQEHNLAIHHVSALGATSKDNPYFTSKYQGEQLIQESGQPYHIFRPSMITGDGNEAIQTLQTYAQTGWIPIPGDGTNKLQPITVEDVATVIEQSLHESGNEVLPMGGPRVMTMNSFAATIAPDAWKLHLPTLLLRPVTQALQHHSWYPLNPSMLDLLTQDNIVTGTNIDSQYDIELHDPL